MGRELDGLQGPRPLLKAMKALGAVWPEASSLKLKLWSPRDATWYDRVKSLFLELQKEQKEVKEPLKEPLKELIPRVLHQWGGPESFLCLQESI